MRGSGGPPLSRPAAGGSSAAGDRGATGGGRVGRRRQAGSSSRAMPPQGNRRRRRAANGDGDGVDRLSGLPEELLLQILARLRSVREAARTGVLSSRWRGLWTALPDLAFVGVGPASVAAVLAQLAPAAAQQVTRPSLNLLDVCFEARFAPESLSSLLHAAARLSPKELAITGELGWDFRGNLKGTVNLPCLDSTAALVINMEEMAIQGEISLAPPRSGEFTALRTLSLFCCCHTDLGALLPLCSRLGVLVLEYCLGEFDAVVHLPLLEELILKEHCLERIDIVAPMLKKLTVEVDMLDDLSVSLSAPIVERADWLLTYKNVWVTFGGLWCLTSVLKCLVQGRLPYVRIQLCADPGLAQEWTFTRAIAQPPVTNFSVLDLDISAEGHVFGPLVLQLLRIRPVIERLNMIMTDSEAEESCSANCPCKQPNNWRIESVALTNLEVVEIVGLKGKDHEVDVLKLLLRCATVLKRMVVRLRDGVSSSKSGYKKSCDIFKEYPNVKWSVYSNHDKGAKRRGAVMGSKVAPVGDS